MRRSVNWRCFVIAALGALLSSAAFGRANAPHPWPQPTYYTVVARRGDTNETLAGRYRLSWAQIANFNGLADKSRLSAGEVLRVPANSVQTQHAVMAEAVDPNARNYAVPPKRFDRSEGDTSTEFRPVAASRDPAHGEASSRVDEDRALPTFAWPLRGELILPFGPARNGERNDGINIAANSGMPIRAAAAGTVTYAGDALKDYGNLILISHPDGYVSAYAHAQSLLVARGDSVRSGEVIATAGETGSAGRPQLHFEIRQGVKPVDPLRLLAPMIPRRLQ